MQLLCWRFSLLAALPERPRLPISFEIEQPWPEKLRNGLLTTFWVVWFFWLGASLGSYLNVIVYRLPLGLDTVSPVSRCPQCLAAIRWRDNIPILGWLVLRGRCRACHEPISSRYITVEAVMGFLFLGLLCVEVLSGGANLPLWQGSGFANLPMIEHLLKWDLIGIYFYHAALLWFLVGMVLFRIDGEPIPPRYLGMALLVSFIPPLAWAKLHPLPAYFPLPAWLSELFFVPGLVDGLIGFVVGVVVGKLVAAATVRLTYRRNLRRHLSRITPEMTAALAVVGGFLGWQAVCGVGFITLLLRLGVELFGRWQPRVRFLPLVIFVAAATMLHIALWAWLAMIPARLLPTALNREQARSLNDFNLERRNFIYDTHHVPWRG